MFTSIPFRGRTGLYLCFSLLLSIQSCTKTPIKKEVEEISEPENLTFTVGGFSDTEEYSDINQGKSEKATIKPSGLQSQAQNRPQQFTSNIIKWNGLDMQMQLTEETMGVEPANHRIKQRIGKSGIAAKKAANIPMEPGKTYRLVIFDTDAGGNPTTLVNQGLGTIGATLKVPVYRNKQYRWVAYSYNRSASIAAVTGNNPTIPTTDNGVNGAQDLLYATGLVQTSDEVDAANPISILFTRKTALIRMEVNARGTFAEIDQVSATVKSTAAGLKRGVLSLKTGNYTQILNASALNLPDWNNVISDTIPLKWVKYHDFHTATSGNQTTTLNISLDLLKLISQRINDAAPNTSSPQSRDLPAVEFTFPTFQANPGKKYTASLQLVEHAVQRGSAEWARGNLYYDPTIDKNQYRFRYDSPHIRNINGGISNFLDTDYWYGGNTPNATYNASADPCKLVFPTNTWRLPTVSEVSSLIASTNPGVIRRNQTADEGWYITWDNASQVGMPQYRNRHLIFTVLGYRNASGALLYFNYEGGNTVFGTQAKLGDRGYYRTNTNNRYFSLRYRTSNWSTALSLTAANGTGNTAAPIRCVRNN